jgi:hypothetical protein
MTASGCLVPTKYLIIEICMAVADLGIITGAPDVSLDAEVLLPKLVDQSSKGSKQTLFHACPQRAKVLGVGLVFIKDGRQTRMPLAQGLLVRVPNIAQVAVRHPGKGVRWRQRVQQHPGVVDDDTVQLIREIGPQIGIFRKLGLYRNGCVIDVNCSVILSDDIPAATAMVEKFPKIVLH